MTNFRLLALHTLHNGIPTSNWGILRSVLEEKGHNDIIDRVVFEKERYRIDKDDFRILIGAEHDR